MNDIAKSAKWDFLKRPSVPVLDAVLGVPQAVLDHGFVRVIDYMGDQAAIVQAARVSYGAGTTNRSDDRGLIHWRATKIGSLMCSFSSHISNGVVCQWIRHRTANVNEVSARYSILSREFYIPKPEDIERQSKTNRQGRAGAHHPEVAEGMAKTIEFASHGAYQLYEELLHGWPWYDEDGERYAIPDNPFSRERVDERRVHKAEQGMSRELARMVLPTNVYTEFYWKVDLHNLLHFLSLRADSHAQREIRDYANVICHIVGDWVPDVWTAFADYVLGAATFSRQEMEVIRSLCRTDGLHRPEGLSDREFAEFQRKLGLVGEA